MGLHGLVDGRTFSAGALLLVCRRAWRVSWEGRPLCVVMEWPMSTGWERLFFFETWLIVHLDYCSYEPFTDVCLLQSNFTRSMRLEAMAEIRLEASGTSRRNKLGSARASSGELLGCWRWSSSCARQSRLRCGTASQQPHARPTETETEDSQAIGISGQSDRRRHQS